MEKDKKHVTSEAARRASAKYDAKLFKYPLRMSRELREKISGNTDGKSMNQYILDLIRADLEKKGVELP